MSRQVATGGMIDFSTKVNGWRMADVLKNLVTSMVFQESFCVFFFFK